MYKKLCSLLFSFCLLNTVWATSSTYQNEAALAFGKEPTNISIIKQNLMHYHDSGTYERDIRHLTDQALVYLLHHQQQKIHAEKKPAIVLDIDETALSNYPHMVELGFGGTLAQIQQAENLGVDPAIKPILQLYQYAKAHQIAVFFITGRPVSEQAATISNLRNAGYRNWDGLIFKPTSFQKKPAAVYKAAVRKQLSEQGYDIVLNIGDQKSDLVGGYADKGFKLPNPYYFIP